MATLRNTPFLKLYVQDFLTDEKLVECSAASHGVYVRLLCTMHKSQEYGTFILKKKDLKYKDQVMNFAMKLGRQMPFDLNEIKASLQELIEEGVITVEGDKLFQKRMIKDCELSEIRSQAGRSGGLASQFAQAKPEANSEANGDDLHPVPNRKKKCLFRNSELIEFNLFEDAFRASKSRYQDMTDFLDLEYYHERIRDWSDSKGEMRKDWLATARSFISNDETRNGQPKLKNGVKKMKAESEMTGLEKLTLKNQENARKLSNVS